MEIVECLLDDPKEGKSSAEFRRINEQSRQSTRRNALFAAHRTAFPGTLCAALPAELDSKLHIRDVLSDIHKTLFLRPFAKSISASSPCITTHKFFHTPLPVSPRELVKQGTALHQAPYGVVAAEVLGKPNSLYRHDYRGGGGPAASQYQGDCILHRTPDEASATQDSNRGDPVSCSTSCQQSKREYAEAVLHCAEISGIRKAIDAHTARKSRELLHSACEAREHELLEERWRLERHSPSLPDAKPPPSGLDSPARFPRPKCPVSLVVHSRFPFNSTHGFRSPSSLNLLVILAGLSTRNGYLLDRKPQECDEQHAATVQLCTLHCTVMLLLSDRTCVFLASFSPPLYSKLVGWSSKVLSPFFLQGAESIL